MVKVVISLENLTTGNIDQEETVVVESHADIRHWIINHMEIGERVAHKTETLLHWGWMVTTGTSIRKVFVKKMHERMVEVYKDGCEGISQNLAISGTMFSFHETFESAKEKVVGYIGEKIDREEACYVETIQRLNSELKMLKELSEHDL